MRRGLLGGTFDPPHIGHLVLADAAHTQLGIDVAWMPAGDPWQKDDVRTVASRMEMVRLTIEGLDGMHLDDREARRGGPTYTVDTIRSLRADGVEPVLILGADAAVGIPTWDRAEQLDDVEVAVAPRPGIRPIEVEAVLGDRVRWLDMPPLDVSSTDLRRRMRASLSVRHLVPEAARRYAVERNLYV